MNVKISLIALVFGLTFHSCLEHEESNKDEKSVENIEKKVNQLVFEVDLETSSADDIMLFANDVFLNNSKFMNIGITHKLNMNETSKNIKFEFPENIKPDVMLALSLGNKEPKQVTIKKINLSYGPAVFNIEQKEIPKYFAFNKFIEYDSVNGIIKTKKVENNLNPLLFLRRKILDSIQKIE